MGSAWRRNPNRRKLEQFARGNQLLVAANERSGRREQRPDYRHRWVRTNEFSYFHLTCY